MEAARKNPPILLAATFIYIVTIATQLISLAFGRADETESFTAMVLPSLIFLSALTIPCCAIGLRLGPGVSLGAPVIVGLISGETVRSRQVLRAMVLPIALSVAVGISLLLLRFGAMPHLPDELPALGHRGVVGGLAVSIGAAVGEEVWFRLGLMTLIVWGITRLQGHGRARPAVLWGVIVVSAVAFGVAHLPQLVSHGAGSPAAITVTILGNVLVGTLYGWCYWKRGLLVAVVSHFTVDLVLHVFPAVL